VEDDIVNALETGLLGQPPIDVFVTEPLRKSSPLWTAPNLTNHASQRLTAILLDLNDDRLNR
jgi:phosphoglycerate dehydrogenase-like enzyme